MDEWIKQSEVQEMFGVDSDTVRRWCKEGTFGHKTWGRYKRWEKIYRIRSTDIAIVAAKGYALFADRPRSEWPDLVKNLGQERKHARR
jgi:hypothetical protein